MSVKQPTSNEKPAIDKGRRRFLIGTTAVIGASGAGVVALPFAGSWTPSERAKAAGAPVEIDISKMEVGQKIAVEWRGKPVWVVRRSKEMLDSLASNDDKLRDPDSIEVQQPNYASNPDRALKAEYLVLVGICTHLGCSPTFRPEVAAADLGSDWKGGFYCPCHGSRFDLAGRVFQNVPANKNMLVPPYKYVTEGKLLIGVDEETA